MPERHLSGNAKCPIWVWTSDLFPLPYQTVHLAGLNSLPEQAEFPPSSELRPCCFLGLEHSPAVTWAYTTSSFLTFDSQDKHHLNRDSFLSPKLKATQWSELGTHVGQIWLGQYCIKTNLQTLCVLAFIRALLGWAGLQVACRRPRMSSIPNPG